MQKASLGAAPCLGSCLRAQDLITGPEVRRGTGARWALGHALCPGLAWQSQDRCPAGPLSLSLRTVSLSVGSVPCARPGSRLAGPFRVAAPAAPARVLLQTLLCAPWSQFPSTTRPLQERNLLWQNVFLGQSLTLNMQVTARTTKRL